MPDVTLSPQRATSAGINPHYHTPFSDANDYKVRNDGNVILLCRNGTGSAATITITTPGTVDGDLAVPDRVVSVPVNGERVIADLDPAIYNSGLDLSFIVRDHTNLRIAVIQT